MSSQSWFRGPRCGVDNCRLNLYRHSDGLTICRYGHVVEGNIEFNDEEDSVVTQTRRLNAVRVDAHGGYISSQASKHRNRHDAPVFLKGDAAFDACMKCFQILLKHQLGQIIDAYMIESVRQDLTNIVKTNWIKFLEYKMNEIDSGPRSDHQDHDLNEEDDPTDDADRRISSGRLYPSPLDTIAIVYILALQLRRYPLYAVDLLRGIRDNTVAYTQAYELFPLETIKGIPPRLRYFQPTKLPAEDKFMATIGDMGALIFKSKVEFHHYLPLCYRTLTATLGLPNCIDIYASLALLVSRHWLKLSSKFGYRSATRGFDAWISLIPEVAACGLLIEVVLCFISAPELWINKQTINIEHWMQLLQQQHESHDFLSSSYLDLSTSAWLETKTENYLKWIEHTVVPKRLMPGSEQDLLAMEKRLWLIFDLKDSLALTLALESNLELALRERVAQKPTTSDSVSRETLQEATQLLYLHFATAYGISERAVHLAHIRAQEQVTAPVSELPMKSTVLPVLRFSWQQNTKP